MKLRLIGGGLCWAILLTGAFAYNVGDGSDGDLTVTGDVDANVAVGGSIQTVFPGATALMISYVSVARFAVGDEILILVAYSSTIPPATTAGRHEFARISSITPSGNQALLELEAPLTQGYSFATEQVFVFEVKNYDTVHVTQTGRLSIADDVLVLAMRASTSVTVDGVISVSGTGYYGASDVSPSQGRSYAGAPGDSPLNNAGGGGGGINAPNPSGGGGGGHATAGSAGEPAQGFSGIPGLGGATYGRADLSNALFFGSGGGSGGHGGSLYRSAGGRGGGILFIATPTINLSGTIEANGANGIPGSGGPVVVRAGGGGGAGGAIWLRAYNLLGAGAISAVGGAGGSGAPGLVVTGAGGAGGDGRLHLDWNQGGNFTTQAGSVYRGLLPPISFLAARHWQCYQ